MVLIYCPAQDKSQQAASVQRRGEVHVCARMFIYVTYTCVCLCVLVRMYVSILGQIGLNITQGIVRKTAWCHRYYTVNAVDLALRISACSSGLWHVHQGWFTDPTFVSKLWTVHRESKWSINTSSQISLLISYLLCTFYYFSRNIWDSFTVKWDKKRLLGSN